jgi:hypothetical protein
MRRVFIAAVIAALLFASVTAGSHISGDFDEAVSVESELGSEIRLLQLANAVHRAIIIGEEALQRVDAANMSSLNDSLNDLYGLNTTIHSYTPSNMSPEAYLAMKGVARNATARFRSHVRPLLDGRDRARIQAAAAPRVEEVNEERRSKVHGLIEEYNERRYEEVVRQAGLNASQTTGSPRDRLEAQLQRLPADARRRVSSQIRERSVQAQVDVQRDEEQRRAVRSQIVDEVRKNKPKTPRGKRGRGRPGGEAVNAYVSEQQRSIQESVNRPTGDETSPQGGLGGPATPPGRR